MIQQAPVGIDIGSSRSVIAIAMKGGVDVITNQANFRQTPNIVGFSQSQRYLGQTGLVKVFLPYQYKSNFKNTVAYTTRFLGLYHSPQFQEEKKYITANTILGDNGKIFFEITYKGNKQLLNSEQIVAAFLHKLRLILSHNNINNTSAVLSVPNYYTDLERKCLLDAAKIAQLQVPRLVNQSTAVSINYGLFRKKDLDSSNKRGVVFVDFGSSKLSAFAAYFTSQNSEIVSQVNNRNLGTRNMDYQIVQFYAQMMLKNYKVDIFESKKAFLKVFSGVQNQRKMLSGNVQSPINLQCVIQDFDLNYLMHREEFQKMINPILEQIRKILIQLRTQLQQKKFNIHSVQLIGGGTRIPSVQKIILDVFKIDVLSRTLNGSETIARGCATFAAILSPLLQVKEYNIDELNPYSISVAWNFVGNNNYIECNLNKYNEKNKGVLFSKDSKLGCTKSLKFTRMEGIQLIVYYQNIIEGFNKYIAYFKTLPVKPKQKEFQVFFKIRLNQSGIIILEDCYLSEDYVEQTKVPKKKDNQKKPEKNENGQKIVDENEAKNTTPPPQEEFEIKNVKKSRATQIGCQKHYVIKNQPKQIEKYFQIEARMFNDDRIINQTYQRKNQLESIIYCTKEKLQNTYKEFINPNYVKTVINFLAEAKKWLQTQGQYAGKSQYIEKINSLKKVFQPFTSKYSIYQELSKTLIQSNHRLSKEFQLLNSNDQKYAHITLEQRQPVFMMMQNYKNWVKESQKLQATIPKYQMPVITKEQVKKSSQEIVRECQKVMSKKAPKDEKIEKEEQTKNKMNQNEIKKNEQCNNMQIQ